uniref:Protein Z-dependent protease inhibitor-like n=1 Tax=Xiphophorus maculatus TaxID=8083 RepID=A0A3B5QRQ5_XIPMA
MAAFLFLHLAFLFLLAGPAAPQTPDPAELDLLNRSADFGARLYRAVAGRTDDNVLLAPLAVFAGMLALLGGTSGPTQNELLQGLTLTGLDPQTLPGGKLQIWNAVLQPALRLQQGAALFLDQSFQAPPSFQDLVQTKYGGQTQSVSFSSPADAQDVINRWVQDRTRHQAQNLLSTLDRRTQLLLVSAADYQMRFNPPFNASLTQVERFYVDRYHVAMVPMMFRADKYFLAYDSNVKWPSQILQS